ncbi:MAG: single-stranded DNA-binding protein [Bacteroidota bacterium]
MNNLKNRVQLIGNLGNDPEVKSLSSGKKVAKFSLATTEHYKNGDGKKVSDTQWHQVVAWDGLANIAEQYLKKGNQIALEGKLIYRSYDGQDGQKRYVTEIVANELLMLKAGNAVES